MLFALLRVREALRSIFRFFTGSSVNLSCKSSVQLVVAGVAIESLINSQLFSRALSIYESSIRPKAKSRPGDITLVALVCPKASPTFGIKPGKAIEYWLR